MTPKSRNWGITSTYGRACADILQHGEMARVCDVSRILAEPQYVGFHIHLDESSVLNRYKKH